MGAELEQGEAGRHEAADQRHLIVVATAKLELDAPAGFVDVQHTGLLEQEPPGAPLSDAGEACCDTVVVGFDDLRLSNAECFGDLNRRFMASGVRGRCCSDQATWSHLACTPWGPPVPPELSAESAELLRAWSLAA